MKTTELIQNLDAVAGSSGVLAEADRVALSAACDRLKKRVETPMEATTRILFAPHQAVALRLAVDMHLFDAAESISVDSAPIRVEQLAEKMQADPLLVTRTMRFLVGNNMFKEVEEGQVVPTELANCFMTGSSLREAVIHITSQNETISTLPTYFEQEGYSNPDDAFNGPFQFAKDTKLHFFDWLAANPRLQHAFNVVMSISRTQHGQRWFEFFPVMSILASNDVETPAVVDVGGGTGHELVKLIEKYPNLSGSLIVQDIPVVIDSIKELPSRIEAMKHDFFAPQPVRGAKTYYLGNVLHDWPDKQARLILARTKEAMGPQSRLLICENVLSDSNVSLYSASTDLFMMANFAAHERTQSQFRALLEQAGLDILEIWEPCGSSRGTMMLFETVVKKA